MAGGRPTKIQERRAFLEDVVQRIANGATMSALAKELGFKQDIIRQEILKDPDLRERWLVAREMRAHALFDEAVDLARELSSTPWNKEQNARVTAIARAIDALKHAAGRLNPQEYGERIPTQPIVPIQIITSMDLGQANPPPLREKEDVYTISVVAPKLEAPK